MVVVPSWPAICSQYRKEHLFYDILLSQNDDTQFCHLQLATGYISLRNSWALQPDDILMLCSDGLWEMVRDNDMEQIIASSARHPSQISTMLVQAALARGGADNISVVVVGLTQPPAS